jgi:hypothetical protein
MKHHGTEKNIQIGCKALAEKVQDLNEKVAIIVRKSTESIVLDIAIDKDSRMCLQTEALRLVCQIFRAVFLF